MTEFDSDQLLKGRAREAPDDRELARAAFALGDIIPGNDFYTGISDVIEKAIQQGHSEDAVRWALWQGLKRKHFHALQGDVVGVANADGDTLVLCMLPEIGASVTVLPAYFLWRKGEKESAAGEPVEVKPDGPVEPDGFRVGKTVYPGLCGKAFTLVKEICKGPDWRITLTEDVQKKIWGESALTVEKLWDVRFKYARQTANRFFSINDLPHRVEKVRQMVDDVRLVPR